MTRPCAEHPIAHRFGTAASLTVTPTESPRSLGNGRLMFRANLNRLGDGEMSGRVVVFAPVLGFGELSAGQPARFRARIGRPTRRDLTVAVLTASGEPVLGRASPVQRVAQTVRSRFAAAALQVLPADQAAMLPGLVLGDTSAVPPATTAQFRTAGLTHLTAVSGANVTIVCGAVLLSARLVGPRPAVALAAVALVAFVIVVQPTASVLRAAVMGALALLAVLAGRRRQAIPVLSAAVLALLVAAPQLAVDVGFALSVSATAALVVLAPIWSARLVARGWPKPLADAVCIALAAQVVTAPLIAAISGQLSLIAVARESRCGSGDSTDHRARDRRRGPVSAVGAGRRRVDPVHRAGAVVAAARGPLGRRGSRRGRHRAVRAGVEWCWSAPSVFWSWSVSVAVGAA